MQKKSVLNFRQFSGIFEDDNPVEGVQMKSIDVVINIFFEIYGVIVTRIGQYKDAVADYQAIANSENEKRGELMLQTINKISDLVVKRTPELKSSMDEYKKSMEFLKQAYDKILLEDKGQLLSIKKKIKDMIISYLDNLVSNVKNTEIPELEKKNESLEYIGDLLLEKDLYQKERIRVIKRLIPLRAKTAELSTKSIFAEMKSAAKSALKKYDDIIKTLQDDSGFEKKKRTERAEEVQNSRFAIISIENELNNTLSKIAIKYGVAKEIDDILKKSLTSLSSANLSLQEIEKKQSLEEEKTKVEDSETQKKEDPKKSIESYGWKSLKDGEEKQVYYKKEDWDDSKSADKQKEQIAIGKIVKGSVDDVKKELKIYNEASKKTFTKSISDVIDKAEGDKNSTIKIKGEDKEKKEENKEENKEYKEIKEGDKDPEAVKSVKKKLNLVLPKKSVLEDTGDYDKKLKESLVTAIALMKSIGILDPSYKNDTSKITLEFQKKLDEYIKEVEQIRKDLPK
jgi:hypothetical protein